MAQHYGSYFYLKHSDRKEIDRLKAAVETKAEIARLFRLPSETICVEQAEVMEYDDSDPNRIVLKFEFRRDLPVALCQAVERSGFQVLAQVYDLGGGVAWTYANGEIIPIPNWLDNSQPAEEGCAAAC